MREFKNINQDHWSISAEDENLPPLLKEREHLCDNNIVRWVIFKSQVRTNFDTKFNLKKTQIFSQSLKFRQILFEKSSILDIKPWMNSPSITLNNIVWKQSFKNRQKFPVDRLESLDKSTNLKSNNLLVHQMRC